MKVLIVASEVVPFAKTGGLADVVGVLPKFLKDMGVDVRVVMPRYYGVDRGSLKKHVSPLGVPMGIIGELWCGVYEGVLPNSSVPIYFMDYEEYFGRANLYNYNNGEGFLDNDNRFVFLSKASLQLCKMLDFKPDIVHANDWHTAIIPLFLNSIYKNDIFFRETASVLTIHNCQYQGQFYKGLMDVLAVGWEHFTYLGLEQDDCVNLLKGGIYHANAITTVSHGYRNELFTKEYAYGLEGVISDRKDSFYGILNGVDYAEWNPESDKFIAKNYSKESLDGKLECKKDLQKIFNLPQIDVPIFGVVSRLVDQKGVDILASAIFEILSLDLQFVLLGNGEHWAHTFFSNIAKEFPEKFACLIGYDNAISHKIEAGADFFVMPSRFEPCGLNQMYSLKYGTPPIVRATGGLDDTVTNFNESNLSGNGFKFYDLNPKALFNTIGWATYTYYNNPNGLTQLRKNGMSAEFTWEESAQKYIDVYNIVINKKRSS